MLDFLDLKKNQGHAQILFLIKRAIILKLDLDQTVICLISHNDQGNKDHMSNA